MKNFIKNILILAFIPGMASLASCSHKHEPLGDYDYDLVEHWHTCICGEVLDKGTHTFDEKDTCTVCGYEDPIYLSDEIGVLTGLTPYGNTLAYVPIDSYVISIRKGSFDNSNAKTVYIPNSVLSIDKGVFENKPITLNFEDTESKWVETESAYVKSWVLDTYDCLIDNVPFKSFKTGIDSIRENGKTVYLLQNVTCNDVIDIRYEITIDDNSILFAGKDITASFDVYTNGGITFNEYITFKGNINLVLSEYEKEFFTSGYAMFENQTKATDDVKAYYQDRRSATYVTKEAQGAPQQFGKVLLDKTYFVYGSFTFSKDYTLLAGLTDVGKLINSLYVNSPFKDQTIVVNYHAFCFLANIEIPIMKSSIGINVYMQKGIYSSVKIGEGISRIKARAFSDQMEKKFNKDLILLISKLIFPFKKLEIGDYDVELEERAFGWCYSLETVTCGPNQKSLPKYCFIDDYNLKEANLENAEKLDKIGENCFLSCDSLNNVRLNKPIEWHFYQGRHYRVEDMTPDFIAELFRSTFKEYYAYRQVINSTKPFTYYNPNVKDQRGNPYYVEMADSFEDALKKSPEGGVIQLVKPEYKLDELKEIRITKDTIIDSSLFEGKKGVIENINLVVEKNKKLIFTKNVDFKGNVYSASDYDVNNAYFNNVGSVACEIDSSNHWALENSVVAMEVLHYKELRPLAASKDDVQFKGYALHNFYGRGGDDIIENLSSTGLMMTKIEIAPQLKSNHTSTVDCLKNNQNLKEVVISDEVTHIRESCFESSKIEIVTFGKEVKMIEDKAFKNCTNLKTVNFENALNLDSFCQESFYGCTNLKEINVSNSSKLEEIREGAFNNSGITKVTLPYTDKWKVNDVLIPQSKLDTPEKVAGLLNGGEYKSSRLIKAS